MVWARRTLGEICREGGGRIQTGPFGSQLHESDYSTDGIPVVMPADIINGKISITRIARVSENHVDRLQRHQLSAGDIVYGRRGDIGRQALVREENAGWLCGTGCLKISLGSGPLSSEFLHRYLSTSAVVGWIEGQAVGATMPNLNTGILERVPVCYPEGKTTQEKIVAILATYDDLIANNQRRIALLETMAEEIYREWFVRMRFPGRDVEKFHAGLPATWQPKKLGQLLQLRYGKALPEALRVAGPYPVYGSAGIVGTHSEPLVSKPSIIVGRKGNVGSVFWASKPFFPIDTVYYVESDLPLIYLRFLLPSMNFINNDAAVPGLNREQAYANEVLLPQDALLRRFEEVVGPLYQKVTNLEGQNEQLMVTRDAILPRLISGKLRVDQLDIQYPPSMKAELMQAA